MIDNSDKTVIFRNHADGSLTLIGLDGVVVEHISAKTMRGEPKPAEDGFDFFRGFAWALLGSSLFWVTVILAMR